MKEISSKIGVMMGLVLTFFHNFFDTNTLSVNLCYHFNGDKLIETAILAFVGGVFGAVGGFIVAVIIKKVFKINIRKN